MVTGEDEADEPVDSSRQSHGLGTKPRSQDQAPRVRGEAADRVQDPKNDSLFQNSSSGTKFLNSATPTGENQQWGGRSSAPSLPPVVP